MRIWLPNGQELMQKQQELTTLYLVFFLQFKGHFSQTNSY